MPEESQMDFPLPIINESLIAGVNDDIYKNKEIPKESSIPQFIGVEEEKDEEAVQEELAVAPEAQETTDEHLAIEQKETTQTEEKKETTIKGEQAVQGKELPEEHKEEIGDEQEEEWEDGPSDFIVHTESELFLQGNVLADIPSQTSALTVGLAPPPEAQKRRKSTMSKSSRKYSVPHDRRISGDFMVADKTSVLSVETLLSEVEAESMESTSVKVEEEVEPEPFDREAYYKMYDELSTDLIPIKIKNNFFQRKMAEYFKKRKMEHVLKETDQQVDTQKKYFQRLDDLWELLQLDQTRRTVINVELDELTKERDEKAEIVSKMKKQLFERENEIGRGLIHTKTGKEIPEKVLERLLKRQSSAVEQISKQNLKLIKIRNMVAEKQLAIQQVETLGPNLRLVDYEQLKVENRSYADKLEEREDELTKLRAKCDEIYQILAHLREKSASAVLDIMSEERELQSVEISHMEARERKNYFKVELDRYRNLINKLKEESGILLKPRMLKDMEYAVNEAETTANILNKVKEKQKSQLSQLRAIRKNIEVAINYMHEKEKLVPVHSKASGLYKGRSSLLEEHRP